MKKSISVSSLVRKSKIPKNRKRKTPGTLRVLHDNHYWTQHLRHAVPVRACLWFVKLLNIELNVIGVLTVSNISGLWDSQIYRRPYICSEDVPSASFLTYRSCLRCLVFVPLMRIFSKMKKYLMSGTNNMHRREPRYGGKDAPGRISEQMWYLQLPPVNFFWNADLRQSQYWFKTNFVCFV